MTGRLKGIKTPLTADAYKYLRKAVNEVLAENNTTLREVWKMPKKDKYRIIVASHWWCKQIDNIHANNDILCQFWAINEYSYNKILQR